MGDVDADRSPQPGEPSWDFGPQRTDVTTWLRLVGAVDGTLPGPAAAPHPVEHRTTPTAEIPYADPILPFLVESPRLLSTGVFAPYSVGDPGRAADGVLPLPDQENWHRRDTVFDGFTLVGAGPKRSVVLRAASVRGLSHRAYGTTRQDEYGYQLTPDGRYLVLCVADGLSSGAWSHLAAEVAVRTGLALLVNSLAGAAPTELDWDQLVGEVAGHIVAFARKRLPGGEGMAVEDVVERMGTTATYAVVDLTGERLDVHAVMVGDSSAWVLCAEGWQPLAEVKNAGTELATSAVEALPSIRQRDRARLHATINPGEALVLMTDGVGDALGEGRGEVGAFLGAAWRTPPHDLEFAGQVGFNRKSFDDDRTVVAVWPIA